MSKTCLIKPISVSFSQYCAVLQKSLHVCSQPPRKAGPVLSPCKQPEVRPCSRPLPPGQQAPAPIPDLRTGALNPRHRHWRHQRTGSLGQQGRTASSHGNGRAHRSSWPTQASSRGPGMGQTGLSAMPPDRPSTLPLHSKVGGQE